MYRGHAQVIGQFRHGENLDDGEGNYKSDGAADGRQKARFEKNCIIMVRFFAPRAILMPISWVRLEAVQESF
jgi:hypothetical protein